MAPPCASWEKMRVPCAPPAVVRHSFGQIYSFRPKNLPKVTRALRGFSGLMTSEARDPLPWLPTSALQSLALKMTPCSSASLAGFGPWVFCGHYMLGVPLPRTLFSVAYSCSDMNKGSTKPALLWVSSGFMQCLTRFATSDLLKMLFTNEWTWPLSKNVATGDHPSTWCGTKEVPTCFASFLSSLSDFSKKPLLSNFNCPLVSQTSS